MRTSQTINPLEKTRENAFYGVLYSTVRTGRGIYCNFHPARDAVISQALDPVISGARRVFCTDAVP